jgi:amidase
MSVGAHHGCSADGKTTGGRGPELEEATIAQLQARMSAAGLTALSLVQKYLTRIEAIDRHIGVNSVIELNPDAEAIAKQLDAERRAGRVRGPLHGIPILLKANIDTADRMQTSAGSLALVGTAPSKDSSVAANLRRAGQSSSGRRTSASGQTSAASTRPAAGLASAG